MLASVRGYRAATSVAPRSNGRTLAGSWSVAHAGSPRLGPRSEGPHGAFRAEHASFRLYGIERRGPARPSVTDSRLPGARGSGALIRPSLGAGPLNRIGARPAGTEGVPGTGRAAPLDRLVRAPRRQISSPREAKPEPGSSAIQGSDVIEEAIVTNSHRVDGHGRLHVIMNGEHQSLRQDARPHAFISGGSPIPAFLYLHNASTLQKRICPG